MYNKNNNNKNNNIDYNDDDYYDDYNENENLISKDAKKQKDIEKEPLSKSIAFITIGTLTMLYVIVELGAALYVGSLTLLSDGFHNLSDVVSLVIAWWAQKAAKRDSDNFMSYGWARAEILGGLTNGCFLLSMSLYVALEAIPRFIRPEPMESGLIFMIVAGSGLAINILGTIVFACTGMSHAHSHGGGGGHSHGGGGGHSHGEKKKEKHGHSHGGEKKKEKHGHSHDGAEKKKEKHGHSHGGTTAAVGINGEENHNHDDHDHHDHSEENHGHSHGGGEKKKEKKHGHSHSHGGSAAEGININDHDHHHDHDHEGHHDHSEENHGHSHGNEMKKEKKHGHSHDGVEKKKKKKKSNGTCLGMDLNMFGVFLHFLGDAISSLFVLITGAVIHFTQGKWTEYIDPAVSLIIVIMIAATSAPLVKRCSMILLQKVPDDIDLDSIRHKMAKVEGVVSQHDLHVWQLVDGMTIASVHVGIEQGREFQPIASKLRKIFHKEGIHSTSIQPEFLPPNSFTGGATSDPNFCIQNCVDDCEEEWCCKKSADRIRMRNLNSKGSNIIDINDI
ncbi:hypothetical protein ACTFIU_006972 [Dictyostelium citrinum]